MRTRRETLIATGVLWALITGAANAAPNATTLVSRPPGLGALPAATDNNASIEGHAVSGNGRYVVFTSGADDLGPAGNDDHAFVRDTQADVTYELDVAGSGGATGNQEVEDVAIDEDGTAACFTSEATNLVSGVGGGGEHVYVVSLGATGIGSIAVVDRATGSTGAIGNGYSADCTLDAAGDRVAFDSSATNIGGSADTDSGGDVYVRDLGASTTTLVDRATGAAGAKASDATDAVISGDGASVAFTTSTALDAGHDSGTGEDVYVRRLGASPTTLLASTMSSGHSAGGSLSSYAPALDDDGGKVAFESGAALDPTAATGTTYQVYVHDFGAGTTSLASRNDGASGAIPNQNSYAPAITGDGAAAGFATNATNLGTSLPAVYVRALTGSLSTSGVSRASGASPGAALDDGASAGGISVGGISLGTSSGGPVVWVSHGDNIDPDVRGEFDEVLERHRTSPFATVLVSRPSGTGPRTEAVDTSSLSVNFGARDAGLDEGLFYGGGYPAAGRTVSGDGRYVVFTSLASGIDAAAAPAWNDVFVRDLSDPAHPTTTLVSRVPGGGAGGDGDSFDPAISQDGSTIAFWSYASNLVAGASGTQLYVYHVADGSLTRPVVLSGNDFVPDPAALSADGSKLAFETADKLDPADTNTRDDVYLRDLAGGTTRLVSPGGATGGSAPAIDGSGTKVAYVGGASPAHIELADLTAGTTTQADSAPSGDSASAPQLSADGTVLAYAQDAFAGPYEVNVSAVVANLPVGTATTLGPAVGTLSGGDGPQLSADGKKATYVLATGSPSVDALVQRDLASGTDTVVSAADGSSTPVEAEGEAAMDADGGCVAFTHFGAPLASPDYGGSDFGQVYLRDVSGDCPVAAPAVVPPIAPPPPGPPAPPAAPKSPAFSEVSVSPSTFRVGSKVTAVSAKAKAKKTADHTSFKFTLSEAATVEIAITDHSKGRRKTSKPTSACVKATHALRHHHSCTITEVILTRKETTGAHAPTFTGRWGKHKKLSPGKYTATLVATDSAKRTSKPVTLHFEVVSH